jgi:hypothetical protein
MDSEGQDVGKYVDHEQTFDTGAREKSSMARTFGKHLS